MSFYSTYGSPELAGLPPVKVEFAGFASETDSRLDTLIDIEDVREYVELADDDSDDLKLEMFRFEAALAIDKKVKRPSCNRNVTCYYDQWSDRFNLIDEWSAIDNIVITYIDEDDTENTFSGDTTIDDTDDFYAIINIENIILSKNIKNPVKITFDYVPSVHFQSAAKVAARFIINQRYYTTGDVIPSNVDMNDYALEVLSPFRPLIS